MISRREHRRADPAFKPSGSLGLRKALLVVHLAWLGSVALCTLSTPSHADEAASATGSAMSQVSAEERERQAESIARSIMSPFCPGRTVSSCPNAGPWRDDIRKWVDEGVDAEEIRRRLHERVPEHNLMGVPPNRLGWALPVGAALLALGVLVMAFRYLLKPAKAAKPAGGNGPQPNGPQPNGPQPNGAQPKDAEPPAATAQENKDLDARLEEELETLDDQR